MFWKSWKFGLILIINIGLIVLLAFGLMTDPKIVPSPLIGKFAPNFEVTSLDKSTSIDLASLKGKPTVLNFWGSWCFACQAESQVLEAFYQKYDKGNQQIHLLGIAFQDTHENASAFAKRFGKSYFLALDHPDGSISLDYGLYGAPETFFIDAKGIIRYKHIGGVTPDLMTTEIEKLLKLYPES